LILNNSIQSVFKGENENENKNPVLPAWCLPLRPLNNSHGTGHHSRSQSNKDFWKICNKELMKYFIVKFKSPLF
jgi:hypothetical protein